MTGDRFTFWFEKRGQEYLFLFGAEDLDVLQEQLSGMVADSELNLGWFDGCQIFERMQQMVRDAARIDEARQRGKLT